MYSNNQGDLPRNSSDRDVHHEHMRRRGTQKYLKESCYHRIECIAATFLAAFMWRRPLNSTALATVRDRAPGPFYDVLGQTHVNGWSRVVVSQNRGSASYIFPLRLGVLQWSRHLFNYWKNKKTIIEIFLILLI